LLSSIITQAVRIVTFSFRVIKTALPNARAGNYIAGQLLCCGLTPLLVYGEAQAAESGDDSV